MAAAAVVLAASAAVLLAAGGVVRWRRRRPSRSRRRPQRPRRRPQRRQRPSRVSDCVCRNCATKQHLLSSIVLRDHHSGHAATSNFKGNAIRRRWFRRIHNLGNVSDSHFSFERDRVVCLCQSCDVREIIRASRRSHGSLQLPRPRAIGAVELEMFLGSTQVRDSEGKPALTLRRAYR